MTSDFPDLVLEIRPDVFEAVMAEVAQATESLMTPSTLEFASRLGDRQAFDDYFPDAHSVRFSEMNEEAEREMAEWDRIIHGDPENL